MDEFHFYRLEKLHRDAIRGLARFKSPDDGGHRLITVSRDAEAKVFKLDSNGVADFHHQEHSFFLPTQISTVCVLDRADLPSVMFIFGCLNGHILVFHGYDINASQCIQHHQNNVCAIRSDEGQTLVATSSWDHNVIIYSVMSDVGQLKKLSVIASHDKPVLDVMFIGSVNHLLTASSDHTVAMWDLEPVLATGGNVPPPRIQTFVGHEDCVRGLLLRHEGSCFYSISNDQTVRYWDTNAANCEKVYIGHEHFIFHISRLADNWFLTCGENNAVMVWRHTQTSPWQRLKLPSVTIWAVLATTVEVFYAAGEDGFLYVLTNRADLQPEPSAQELYDEMLVKQTKISMETVAGLKLYEENSLVTVPPKKEGERRLIRSMQDDTVLVYEWDKVWRPIGCVPDFDHQQDVDRYTGRVFYNEEFYDEVFNVKLNNKTYKLPYNRDQDPWVVAQTFIEQNQLDYGALTSLVQCIVNYASYKPKSGGGDEFSGSMFPMYDFRLYEQLPNLTAFRNKFEELNTTVDEAYRLQPEHIQVTTGQLQNPEPLCSEFCDAMEKLLQWPAKIKFVVYDLLRLLLANKFFNTYFIHRMESSLFRCDTIFGSIVRLEGCDELAGQLTSLRVLANLFASVHGSQFMYKNFPFVHANLPACSALKPNLNVHLAYSSIWYNYSVLLADWRKKQNLELKQGLMGKILEHGRWWRDGNISPDLEKSYDKVVWEMIKTFGNLVAARCGQPGNHQTDERIQEYMRIVRTFPERYKQSTDIRYGLAQIEMMLNLGG